MLQRPAPRVPSSTCHQIDAVHHPVMACHECDGSRRIGGPGRSHDASIREALPTLILGRTLPLRSKHVIGRRPLLIWLLAMSSRRPVDCDVLRRAQLALRRNNKSPLPFSTPMLASSRRVYPPHHTLNHEPCRPAHLTGICTCALIPEAASTIHPAEAHGHVVNRTSG